MKPNRKQICQLDMKQRILTLDIEPGGILDEVGISERYGLSRTPLREVFQRLAGEGYISIEENRGATVSTMDLSRMRHFFQAAPMVYASISRLATENASAAQIDDLKNVQAKFRSACEDDNAPEMAIQNHKFHHLIGEMAASPYLLPSLNRLQIDHTRMSHSFYRPRTTVERKLVDEACDQHDKMIVAIESRQPAVAVELTLEHWALSRDRIEQFVRPDALPIDIELPAAKDQKHAI